MTKRPVYVIGHKNPDTDSIISAISYANFKRALGVDAVAGRLGGVSSETEFLLKRYGFEEPVNLFSAKSLLKDIELDVPCLVPNTTTIKEALDLVVSDTNNRSVFIANDDKTIEGVVSVADITSSLWTSSEEYRKQMLATVRLEDVVKTLSATIIYEAETFNPDGTLEFFPSYATKVHDNAIVVVNNSPEIQRHCLNEKIALLIIVGEDWIDDVTLNKAKLNGVSVIATKLSPLSVSQLVFQSPLASNIMTQKDKVVSFNTRDAVDDVNAKMAKTRFHAYPVLDNDGKVVASVGRYHLLNYEKNKFILVDHNEVSQTIDDISSGEIIEIVDHHRFGGLETRNPVTITTMIVGATCTIIALKYIEYKVELDKKMAGLLLGGIIADTMNFKSPTTTQIDIDMAKRLEEISGDNIEEIAKGLIDSSESILTKRNIDIVYGDFKEFDIKGMRVGISQTQCKTKEEFEQIKDKMSEYLDETAKQQKYELLLVMFTIPTGSGSYILGAGPKAHLVEEAFVDVLEDGIFAVEVVSRKKQVLPAIIEAVEKNG